jgi:hypothetical protein
MKKAIAELKKIFTEESALDAQMDAAEQEDNDELWSALYEQQYELHQRTIGLIVKATGGAIDSKTARAMIITKRDALIALLNRTA